MINRDTHWLGLHWQAIFSKQHRIPVFVAIVLILSGLFHLIKLVWDGSAWEGPLSPRKPGLFGVSTGLTVASLAWVIALLPAKRWDRRLADSMSILLLIEVGLITLQYWRGVGSHFNRATLLDASIEISMLVIILVVTISILYIAYRSMAMKTESPATTVAIQSGMWLLFVSCMLGIGTTILGVYNQLHGESSEIWRKAGVLKYPHGVAIHAIQTLPVLAWIGQRIELSKPVMFIWAIAAGHLVMVLYSIWQTLNGQGRFSPDRIGLFFLGMLVATLLVAVFSLLDRKTR